MAGLGQAAGHEGDHGPVDHRLGTFREGLVITDKTAVQDKPPEGALDCPSARQDREPLLPFGLADDLEADALGSGVLQALQGFMTNPAGAAVVNAIGPIRQLVRSEDKSPRRYLVIAPGTVEQHGAPIQVQAE